MILKRMGTPVKANQKNTERNNSTKTSPLYNLNCLNYLPHDGDVAHLGNVVTADAGEDQGGHPVGVGLRSVADLVAVHWLIRVATLHTKKEKKRKGV